MSQPDEVIWNIINHGHCSFKSKVADERTFCQNPYNVTGLCIRSACPLANSRYATIREDQGICYLYMKTVERAHTPKHLWERIKLPANYAKALELVSKELEYFPKVVLPSQPWHVVISTLILTLPFVSFPQYLQHRNKQRLTKIHHMIIRMRKLKLKAKPKLVTMSAVVEKRERKKEAKALKAAVLERSIENELLERLKKVSEGEIYNYPEQEYNSAIQKARTKFEKEGGEADEDDEELEDEDEDEDEEELEEEELEDYQVEYVEAPEGMEEDDEGLPQNDEDLLNLYAKLTSKRKAKDMSKAKAKAKGADEPTRSSRRRKATVEVEYEDEDEDLVERQREEADKVANMQFNFS
jgi:protein MAK16